MVLFKFRVADRSQIVPFAVEVQSFLKLFPTAELFILDNSLEFLLGEADEDVLWFEIGVDDPADAIEKIEAHEDLSCNLFDDVDGEAFAVVFLEDLPEIYA